MLNRTLGRIPAVVRAHFGRRPRRV
jgi:hypothetical protein